MAADGTPIWTSNDLVNIINAARLDCGGRVNLTVRDVRTGGLVKLGLHV